MWSTGVFAILISLTQTKNAKFIAVHKFSTNTKKVIPGWNDYVMDAKASVSDAHKLWCFWGKPKNGYIFELMQRTRAQYKYAIRHCRKHEARIHYKQIL